MLREGRREAGNDTEDVFDEVGIDGFVRGHSSRHQHGDLRSGETSMKTYIVGKRRDAYVLNVGQPGRERWSGEHVASPLFTALSGLPYLVTDPAPFHAPLLPASFMGKGVGLVSSPTLLTTHCHTHS